MEHVCPTKSIFVLVLLCEVIEANVGHLHPKCSEMIFVTKYAKRRKLGINIRLKKVGSRVRPRGELEQLGTLPLEASGISRSYLPREAPALCQVHATCASMETLPGGRRWQDQSILQPVNNYGGVV